MDEQEEVQQNNMISNLPLLFANGYPTSLEKISEIQLEKFIPFMVQCSLGHINLQGRMEYSEPEWWPEDLAFTVPFTKPKKFFGDWMEKMKEVVLICYQFHKSVFLLRFCNDLASYEHATLRFINNQNSTTSLYDRRSNKLLVTFRNENMSYDQPQRSRKCLLQQKSKAVLRNSGHELHQIMVEPAPFDIYLCDNCDAELYSKEAILEHEKTCNVEEDDDDVILCDTPEPFDKNQCVEKNKNIENNEQAIGFFLNFGLQPNNEKKLTKTIENNIASNTVKEDNCFIFVDRNRRMPRRNNRAVQSLNRCPSIPLSSPAGQFLLQKTKTVVSAEYLSERLERVERFCHATILSRSSNKPKFFEKKYPPNNPHCTFKKPQQYSSHRYVFPRRQFSQRRRKENFLFLNSPLIRRCRPISVRLKKITETKFRGRHKDINTKLNIKLTRDTSRESNWKISSSSSAEIIVDTIDLCSSDDEDYTDSSKNTYVVSMTAISKGNTIKSKKIAHKINSSDVTLVRKLSKNYSLQYEKFNSSLVRIVSPKRNEILPNKSQNLQIAPPISSQSDNLKAITKPLRPSVYFFSNYTANSLTAFVTNSNELVTTTDGVHLNNHNQENHVQSLPSPSNNVSKRSTPVNTSDWFPNSSNINSNLHNSGNSNTHNHSLVQNFNAPARIVSIDLTT